MVTALLAGCIVEDPDRIWSPRWDVPTESDQGGGPANGGVGGGGGAGESEGTGGGGGADPGATSCDALASCGTYSSGCGGCAVHGICAEPYNNCDEMCVQYNMCLGLCAPENIACQKSCKDNNPSGAERYDALISCIVCEACPNSCSMYTSSICP
jgi:hypothetical protein